MNFLLSHNDMDGYGCVLTANKIGPLKYINTGYDDVSYNLRTISEDVLSKEKIDNLYITDLNFSENDTIELYKVVKHFPDVNVLYVDHHPYESEKQNKIFEKMKEFPNFKFVHTEKYCATYLFYQYMLRHNMMDYDEDYDILMKTIDAYDTWKTDSNLFQDGLLLNDIVFKWKRYDSDKFVKYMGTHGKITPELRDKMNEYSTKKKEYFDRLEREGFIIPFGDIVLFLADNFVGHITVDYPMYKYYVNGRTYGSLSVRINKSVLNAKEVKQSIVEEVLKTGYVLSSGGHDHAFGITLHPEHKDKMLNVAETVVRHLHSII